MNTGKVEIGGAKTALKKLYGRGLEGIYPAEPRVLIGTPTCGVAAGAAQVIESLQEEFPDLEMAQVGCLGLCWAEPLVYVQVPGVEWAVYRNVCSCDVKEIVPDALEGKYEHDRLLGSLHPQAFSPLALEQHPLKRPDGVPSLPEHPALKKQQRIVMRNAGVISPTDIGQYVARGGYFSLEYMLKGMKPDQVIVEVKNSGLRGRGGAGFPTGLKWQFCADNESDVKYIICNADEGDPGAYMDRSVLESDPYSVLEGMVIGAYATGATEGYIYIRYEYPLAIRHLKEAIRRAREHNLLGENILGSGFSFDINMVEGAGAFVCGEETAMIASIEGFPGKPRPRPPYPAAKGLWGKPTNINNVETWANVPPIIMNGSEWYASLGHGKSKGTKVFSLVGKVPRAGLVEVPMGITITEIVEDIGGAENPKAIQSGGPSGGCIPVEHFEALVTYEDLAELGSIMGSGGMVALDRRTCAVDIAHYFLSFTRDESCGKCAPCRVGTRQMLQVLDRIKAGEGREGDIELLESIAEVMMKGSLCALGQTAPNPVLTTIRYFRDEYEAHIYEHRCPAGVCRDLIRYFVVEENCTGCMACARACPTEAITGSNKEVHHIDQEKCIRCGECFNVCNFDAIEVVSGERAK